ncbi:MAG: TnsA endonuclease N-terminal domain-containing protein [Sphingomonas sp.]|jgi:hypothetical protein|uniref:TnsA endonuclease N-terminal domain-containing protein n=1 Tax=Sphingomonas sp. TaxID=28214 RepID=UPI0035667AB5
MKQRHGQPWEPAEDRNLETAFRNGASTEDLAARHERGAGAIKARLERLGLVRTISPPPMSEPVLMEQQQPETQLSIGIDRLVAALVDLKQQVERGPLDRHSVAAVAREYDRVDALLMATIEVPKAPDDAEQAGDPLPDRLREALAGLVRACVSNLTDRLVAIRLLGLDGDGERVTLAQVGGELDRTPERMRQRRNRAFRSINAALPRRVASATRLRAVLADLSADTDWTDPAEAARAVARLINSNFMAARQLTLMLMLASGAAGQLRSLRRAAEQAAMDACRDPELLGRWRLDRWPDAASKAILRGQFACFDALPEDLNGLKRAPAVGSSGEAIPLRSDKLNRIVACESAMELRVFTWLERSKEVRWYQEQPLAIPYAAEGRDRLYYPDAVVWDREGRLVVVEVKPVFNMFRQRTLEKGLAAIGHLQPRGIGYLLVDSSGYTLADLAGHPYDQASAEKVEALFAKGRAPFSVVRDILSGRHGRFDFAAFVSMVVNRDWAVTDVPVTISRLPGGQSFRPLLGLD